MKDSEKIYVLHVTAIFDGSTRTRTYVSRDVSDILARYEKKRRQSMLHFMGADPDYEEDRDDYKLFRYQDDGIFVQCSFEETKLSTS